MRFGVYAAMDVNRVVSLYTAQGSMRNRRRVGFTGRCETYSLKLLSKLPWRVISSKHSNVTGKKMKSLPMSSRRCTLRTVGETAVRSREIA